MRRRGWLSLAVAVALSLGWLGWLGAAGSGSGSVAADPKELLLRLLQCCQYVDSAGATSKQQSLHHCVMDIQNKYMRTVSTPQDPSSTRFLILTRVTQSIWGYTAFSSLLRTAYAISNGYQTVTSTREEIDVTEDYLVHPKLSLIAHTLRDRCEGASDYVVWMDGGNSMICFYLQVFVISLFHV
jgi:hypothetical protein